MGHAKHSPSSAHRWMRCPGSVREEAKHPDNSGPAAIDGTHTHSLLELCLRDNVTPDKFLNMNMKDNEGEFLVEQDRVERVQFALDYIAKRVEEIDGDVKVIPERAVNPVMFVGFDDAYGTADVTLIGDNMIEVIDYKDGMGKVDVEGNEQLELYGLGALAAYKAPEDQPYPIQKVRLTVIQPKLRVKGGSGISSVEMDTGRLMCRGVVYNDGLVKAHAPDAPLVPGETQCKFCRAKGSCKALGEKALTDAGIKFENLDMAQQSADQDPNSMSDERLVEIVQSAPLIRQMLASAEEEALKRMQAGKSLKGLKLVRGRGSRSWALKEDEMAEKLRKMGIPKDALFTQKLVSPAQVEKLTWLNRKAEKKSLSERQLKMLQQDYISKSEGKLIVALDSDDRSAVVTDASSMFGEVQPQADVPDFLK